VPEVNLKFSASRPPKKNAARGIVRILKFARVARFVETFGVERFARRFRMSPKAGRHVRTADAKFGAAVARRELDFDARHGRPDRIGIGLGGFVPRLRLRSAMLHPR